MFVEVGRLDKLVFDEDQIGGQGTSLAQSYPCLCDIRIRIKTPDLESAPLLAAECLLVEQQVSLDSIDLVPREPDLAVRT